MLRDRFLKQTIALYHPTMVLAKCEEQISGCSLCLIKGVPSAESSRSVRGLGKGVSGKLNHV